MSHNHGFFFVAPTLQQMELYVSYCLKCLDSLCIPGKETERGFAIARAIVFAHVEKERKR